MSYFFETVVFFSLPHKAIVLFDVARRVLSTFYCIAAKHLLVQIVSVVKVSRGPASFQTQSAGAQIALSNQGPGASVDASPSARARGLLLLPLSNVKLPGDLKPDST